MSDAQYPDNPDIGFRSTKYNSVDYNDIKFVPSDSVFVFTIEMRENKNPEHKLTLENIDLSEFIPTTPPWIKGDAYLTKIGLINQEWNRQQVRFTRNFKGLVLAGNEFEEKELTRIDIARNCLSSLKWEIFLYHIENEKEVPYYHGWFTFSEELYKNLFEEKNDLNFSDYETHLTKWTDPESEVVNFNLLRKKERTMKVAFQNLNNNYYPEVGERAKKKKNIIFPKKINSIHDLLSDKTLFATFTKEGLYDTREPRSTQLGRLAQLDSIYISKISSPNRSDKKLLEFKFYYTHPQDSIKTELVIGGIDTRNIPQLDFSELNSGWQNSMGIANHTFYDSYENMNKNPSTKSPYYAIFTDENQKWLDSHQIGVDGPLMFLDKRNPNVVHIMLLSFERHSFVGHYIFNLNQIKQ